MIWHQHHVYDDDHHHICKYLQIFANMKSNCHNCLISTCHRKIDLDGDGSLTEVEFVQVVNIKPTIAINIMWIIAIIVIVTIIVMVVIPPPSSTINNRHQSGGVGGDNAGGSSDKNLFCLPASSQPSVQLLLMTFSQKIIL